MACECPVCCCTDAVETRLELSKQEVLEYLQLTPQCITQITAQADGGATVLHVGTDVHCFKRKQCIIVDCFDAVVESIDYESQTITIKPPLPEAVSNCAPIYGHHELGLIDKMLLAAKQEADRCLNNPFVDGCCKPLEIPDALCMPILQLISRWYHRRSIGLTTETVAGLESKTWTSDAEFEKALCKWAYDPVMELDPSPASCRA